MAEKEDLDLDAEKPSAGGKKKLILIIIAAVLLIGLSVGLTLLLVGGGDDASEGAEGDAVEETALTKPIYLPLEKITVNLSQQGKAKFLQVEIQLMSRQQKVLDAVSVHMPVIRNDMLVLLASQPSEKLASLEGKEQLRQEIAAKIQSVLSQQEPDLKGSIEAVYFTRFIMQ